TPADTTDDFQSFNPLSTNAVDALGNPTDPVIPATSFFKEVLYGDSIKPRVTVGIGVNWNSPFGPFRIDLSHALIKQEGDDTKTLSFNVGTQF
ncbi:MAG: BamA/TamA family outer membrane protein, partial [Qipengyuania vulgaris]